MSDNQEHETTQFLTFRLEDEMFALNVEQVREVLDLSTITKVPGAPEFMRGVINVRGRVVPVMDLRLKFNLTKTEKTMNTRIVVMELTLEGEKLVVGALADSVHEVCELESGRIEKPPKLGSRWRSEFIKGIGKQDDQFIIILDIDKVFSMEELDAIETSGAEIVMDDEPGAEQRPYA